jgi:NAD(P)-dependent dehydrogenase (short-subunit alcohol dehydrogenase family)
MATDARIEKLILDVTDEGSIRAAVAQIVQAVGRIDVLVNNACHVAFGTVESCSLQQQQRSMDVNYFGVVRMLQAVLPLMRRQRRGRVINISSIAGFDPYPPLETYSASKFALEGLSESLATTVAPWNIWVSLVEPGGVNTEAPMRAEQGERTPEDGDCFVRYARESQKRMVASYKAGAALRPDEVAELIRDILVQEKPHLRYQVGEFTRRVAELRFSDPTGDAFVTKKAELLEEAGLYALLRDEFSR